MEQSSVFEEDIYDCLGEPLWSFILSLLPLHEAVKTSVLSQVWRRAWASIPYLDIDVFQTLPPGRIEETMEEEEEVAMEEEEERDQKAPPLGEWTQIVDKILMSHTDAVQRCRISTWYCKFSSHVDRWIRELMERFIGELAIECGGLGLPYEVPHLLFQCKTLKTLELHGCAVKLPSNISLGCKNLRTVRFYNTQVENETIQCFLYQCSLLDNLTLHGISSMNGPFLDIASSHLRDLEIDFFGRGFELRRVCINAPHLKNLKMGDSIWLDNIEILAPQLEMIHCYTHHDAWLDRLHYKHLEGEGLRLINFLKSLLHVKVMKLCGFTSKCLASKARKLGSLTFTNMKELIIEVDLSLPVGAVLLSELLHSGICVEDLQLWSDYWSMVETGDDCWKDRKSLEYGFWEDERHLHYCLSHLKRLEIYNYKGNQYDFNFAHYILNKANMLRSMKISYWYVASADELDFLCNIQKRMRSDVELSISETYKLQCPL